MFVLDPLTICDVFVSFPLSFVVFSFVLISLRTRVLHCFCTLKGPLMPAYYERIKERVRRTL